MSTDAKEIPGLVYHRRDVLKALGISNTILKEMLAAGIPHRTPEGRVDFHSLRSTYITGLIRGGANIKTVQVLARHASPSTTLQFYARATEADLRAAVEALP